MSKSTRTVSAPTQQLAAFEQAAAAPDAESATSIFRCSSMWRLLLTDGTRVFVAADTPAITVWRPGSRGSRSRLYTDWVTVSTLSGAIVGQVLQVNGRRLVFDGIPQRVERITRVPEPLTARTFSDIPTRIRIRGNTDELAAAHRQAVADAWTWTEPDGSAEAGSKVSPRAAALLSAQRQRSATTAVKNRQTPQRPTAAGQSLVQRAVADIQEADARVLSVLEEFAPRIAAATAADACFDPVTAAMRLTMRSEAAEAMRDAVESRVVIRRSILTPVSATTAELRWGAIDAVDEYAEHAYRALTAVLDAQEASGDGSERLLLVALIAAEGCASASHRATAAARRTEAHAYGEAVGSGTASAEESAHWNSLRDRADAEELEAVRRHRDQKRLQYTWNERYGRA